MTNVSSYLDYLPPVLWSQRGDSSQFLGRMLCIFEKILTGVPDEFSVGNGTNGHDNFEKTIDELNRIFDPWKTNKNLLPWLASWVSLPLQKDWSEYQLRKFVSEIVPIYQERGLRKGLHAYLDIYALTEARPRIAIDDGDAILRATLLDNGTATLHTVAHSFEVLDQPVLLHPTAIAADSKNNYIVVDEGNTSLKILPTLWKLSSNGEVEFKSIPNKSLPIPHYLNPSDPKQNPLFKPTAVIVDKQDNYCVVDAGDGTNKEPAIYRFKKQTLVDPAEYTYEKVIINSNFKVVYPVDMILDNSGSFVILDRGLYPKGETPVSPIANSGQKIVVVSEGPMAVNEHCLKTVIEPAALAMNSSKGYFIVADAKAQSSQDPANLVMVVPGDDEWKETPPLLDKENPLIFPVGLAFEDPQTLIVCDTGVRWGFEDDDEKNRFMAESAAIYRIDISQNPATITRVTYEKKLVNPTKMMIDRKGKPIITDRGESQIAAGKTREWRSKANEFGVIIYFSEQRKTTFGDRNKIRWQIKNIIDEQKPGNTSWWM